MTVRLSRRRFIQIGAAGIAGVPIAVSAAASPSVPRVVTLDVTSTQVAVSAGARLIAAAAAIGFRAGTADLVLNDAVIDVGHPAEPNLELLQGLRPDLFLSAWPVAEDSPLRRIAPVLPLNVFDGEDDFYSRVETAVLFAGKTVGTAEIAEEAVAAAETQLAVIREAVGGKRSRAPIYLVNLNQDGVNLLGYGRHSLMDAVMRRVGVDNAWTAADDMWGWYRTGPQALGQKPAATIIHLRQYWEGAGLAMRRLTSGAIWNALPQVRTGRFREIAPVDIFGGLQSATRFATLIATALAGDTSR